MITLWQSNLEVENPPIVMVLLLTIVIFIATRLVYRSVTILLGTSMDPDLWHQRDIIGTTTRAIHGSGVKCSGLCFCSACCATSSRCPGEQIAVRVGYGGSMKEFRFVISTKALCLSEYQTWFVCECCEYPRTELDDSLLRNITLRITQLVEPQVGFIQLCSPAAPQLVEKLDH